MMVFQIIMPIKRVSILFSLSFLIGCGGGNAPTTQAQQVPNYAFAMPKAISRAAIGDDCSSSLSAQLTLDEKSVFNMSPTPDANTWETTITGLAAGLHQFQIDFFCTTDAYGGLTLASANKSFDLQENNQLVTVNDSDYLFPDQDDDGVSNLDELDAGTDPLATAEDSTIAGDSNNVIDTIEPAANSTGVARDAVIKVKFTEDIHPGSLNTNSFTVTHDGKPINGIVDYEVATKTATFSLDNQLWAILATFDVTLTQDVLDADQSALFNNAISWKFTVQPGNWSSAQTLGSGEKPRITSDGSGNAALIWKHTVEGGATSGTLQSQVRTKIVKARYYDATSGWQSSQQLVTTAMSEENGYSIFVRSADVAMVPSGKALAIWEEAPEPKTLEIGVPGDAEDDDQEKPENAIKVLSLDENIPTTIFNDGTTFGDNKILATGENTVMVLRNVRTDTGSDIYAARTSSTNGNWLNPEPIGQSNDGIASSLQLVTDEKGNYTAAWDAPGATENSKNILANHFSADLGSWGDSQSIEQNDSPGQNPKIATNAAGDVIAVWQTTDGLAFNRYDAQSSTWGNDDLLPITTNDTNFDYDVVMDQQGNAFVISSHDQRIQMLRWDADSGEWTQQEEGSDGTRDAEKPVVGVNNFGLIIAAWHESGGETDTDILVKHFDPLTREWSKEFFLSSNGNRTHDLRLKVDPNGEIFAVWQDRDDRIVARQYQ